MDLWTEMRTAMVLVRLGTVSAAADELGIHRATVSRHVDALEERLGAKLFLRHKNGYTPTQDGLALQRVAESADSLISDFVDKTNKKNTRLSGVLTISALNRVFSEFSPAIQNFIEEHHDVSIRLATNGPNANLELAEADVAILVGDKPVEPDYVVLHIHSVPIGLCGHKSYFERHGVPTCQEDLDRHRFVAIQFPNGSCDVVDFFDAPVKNIEFITVEPASALESIKLGIGLGGANLMDIEADDDLLEVLPREHPIAVPVWLVTHMDLHRTPLVQAFVKHIRGFAAGQLAARWSVANRKELSPSS